MAEMKMLAVCAGEGGYGVKLAEYVRNQTGCPFLVQAFSTVETLKEYLKLRSVDAILLDEVLYEKEEWQEYSGILCLLGNGIGQEDYPPRVFKYQPARDIVHEILAQWGSVTETGGYPLASKKRMEIFGVYSPVGRCGKSLFTLALGLELARYRRTLYLNLESWPALEGRLKISSGESLSDLLYFLRQKREPLPERIYGMAVTVCRLDMIPPVRAPADLAAVSVEDWQYLFETLRCRSSYEAVVLDIGDSPQPTEKLLGICGRVYVPTLPDRESGIKLERFLTFMRENACRELAPEIETVSLPGTEPAETDGSWAEQILWGNMGDFVRRLLKRKGGKTDGTAATEA
ncbi:MAG TPA: hypothetical protein DF613_11650 [Lachnospiraceae bacterium]|nr:hypothetical protein [Lachnospiraceae bacterium]